MVRMEDLWEAFPIGSYAVSGLMRLVEIRESREIPTAAIQGWDRAVVLINPDFIARHAPTPERQAALMLHELMHVFLGHTHRPVTLLDNFVFDAVINAMISNMTRDPAYFSLFTSTYSDQKFPECFLRPPDESGEWLKRYRTPRALWDPQLGRQRSVYRALYDPYGTTYSKIRSLFRKHSAALLSVGQSGASEEEEKDKSGLPQNSPGAGNNDEEDPKWRDVLKDVPLLGSHPARLGERELGAPIRRALAGIMQRILRDWSSNHGRSPFGWPEEKEIQLPDLEWNTASLVTLMRRVAREGDARIPWGGWESTSALSVIPALDRRSNVLRLVGLNPLLHNYEGPAYRQAKMEPVHVYVDVSGSVENYIGSLYQAVLRCRDFVHQTVHLFSTLVSDISLEELKRGLVRTTYGTTISCVIEHMRQSRIRRAVILTDGLVGTPGEKHLAFLKSCRLAVALTPDGTLSDMQSYVRHSCRLLSD